MNSGRARGPLRLAHVVASVGRQSGGLGPNTLGLAIGQHELGAQPTIWCMAPPRAVQEAYADYVPASVEIVSYPGWGPGRVGVSPAMEAAARQRAGENLAVLHQHSLWLGTSRVTMRWRKAWRRPTIISPQGALLPYALARSAWKKTLAGWLFERRNLRAASCLHAASAAEAASFRRYGLANPIAIIPNAIPHGWLRSAGDGPRFRHAHKLPAEARLMLFVSRVHPIKGLPLLFEAIRREQAHLADWHLVVAGPDEGGHTAELVQLAQRLGITPRVHFIGAVFGAEKRDAFAAAELFVLPTHSENFAIAVAEALAAGVPVLTTKGAPWEELETHACGWWTDTSAAAIGEALREATQSPPAALAAMGQRGRQLITERYTWPIAAQKTLELYAWLLGRAPRPDCVTLV